MENDSNFKSTGIISKISKNHWDNYYIKYKSMIDVIRY